MVHQTHRFDVCNTCQVHTHAHHIAQVGAGLRQRESNRLVNIARLAGRVTGRMNAAGVVRSHRSRNKHQAAGHHDAAVAEAGFPRCCG